MNTIGKRLRFWRERYAKRTLREYSADLNEKLAACDQISFNTLANNEKKPPGPRASLIVAVAELRPEIRLEWLLWGEGEPTHGEEAGAYYIAELRAVYEKHGLAPPTLAEIGWKDLSGFALEPETSPP